MRIPCLAVFASFLIPFSIPDSLFGWGQDGHRITAEIAERNLTPAAAAGVRAILGEESLAEISTWPDEIRSDPAWDFAGPWHYISIDDDESWEDFERVPEEEGDVLYLLDRLEILLRDPDADRVTLSGLVKPRGSSLRVTKEKEVGKREVLAFFIHLLADLHQPLHVGRRDDQGGNRIQVEWFDEEMSLHKLWDEALIESTNLSYTEFATFLNRVSEEDRSAWNGASYLEWAKESKAVREQVYDFGAQRSSYFLNVQEPPRLGYDYRSAVLPLVRTRLQQAGIRIAAKLNEIFASTAEE